MIFTNNLNLNKKKKWGGGCRGGGGGARESFFNMNPNLK